MRRALAAMVTFATGCTLLTSLDGLSGGPQSDGGTSDARAPDAGAPPHDAAIDSPSDAPSDAPVGCAALGRHTLCDDFDDAAAPVQGGWDFTGPGAVAADTSLFVSPPRAAALTLAKDSPGCSYAELGRSFPGTFHRASVATSLRLGAADPSVDGGVANVLFVGVGGKCAIDVTLDRREAGIYVENDPSGSPGQSYPLASAVSAGTWARVRATLDTTTSPYVVVEIDGQNVLTLTSIADVCKISGPVSVGVGPHCVPTTDRVEVRVDDVTVDVE